jgi:hypothetical protein
MDLVILLVVIGHRAKACNRRRQAFRWRSITTIEQSPGLFESDEATFGYIQKCIGAFIQVIQGRTTNKRQVVIQFTHATVSTFLYSIPLFSKIRSEIYHYAP